MGLFGSLVGWDQQKDAHNAVLANHLVQTASADLKRDIARALIRLQKNVANSRLSDQNILVDLSNKPRIVQMNFVALACNNIGVGPNLRGLYFENVQNPYRSNNESSIDRIGVALNDLSRRSGVRLSWPGNDARIDFLPWVISAAAGNAGLDEMPRARRALNPFDAADLAYRVLLSEVIERSIVESITIDLAGSMDLQSDQELALASALYFFEIEDLIPHLRSAQLMARLSIIPWLEEGQIQLSVAKHFENRLYNIYKP